MSDWSLASNRGCRSFVEVTKGRKRDIEGNLSVLSLYTQRNTGNMIIWEGEIDDGDRRSSDQVGEGVGDEGSVGGGGEDGDGGGLRAMKEDETAEAEERKRVAFRHGRKEQNVWFPRRRRWSWWFHY
ncbi:hypothetical protein Droror1_Dr00012723 [Drosera rotundifolia]